MTLSKEQLERIKELISFHYGAFQMSEGLDKMLLNKVESELSALQPEKSKLEEAFDKINKTGATRKLTIEDTQDLQRKVESIISELQEQLADKDKVIAKLLRQAVDPYRVEGRWVHNCDTCKLPKEIEKLKDDCDECGFKNTIESRDRQLIDANEIIEIQRESNLERGKEIEKLKAEKHPDKEFIALSEEYKKLKAKTQAIIDRLKKLIEKNDLSTADYAVDIYNLRVEVKSIIEGEKE